MINYAENSLDRQIQIPRPPRILSRIFGFVEQIKELAKKPPVERPPEPASPSHLLLHNPPHAFRSHILLPKLPPQKSTEKTGEKVSPNKEPEQKQTQGKQSKAKDPPPLKEKKFEINVEKKADPKEPMIFKEI
uniref:Uncharacterized protein n=1 Tax=Picea sitchensis TaxID=3332 RepID=A9NQK2_PICSI|nr:unknown [Picea sitchensis]